MVNLKKIRIEQGKKQKDLAVLLGVTRHHVSNLENEVTPLNSKQIIILCNALNVRADYLLGLEEKEESKIEGE